MIDIVDRLRALDAWALHDAKAGMHEAADEIGRLRSALREIAEAWDWWQQDTSDRCQSVPSEAVSRARAALGEDRT